MKALQADRQGGSWTGSRVGLQAKGAEERVEGEESAREDLPEPEEAPPSHFQVVG